MPTSGLAPAPAPESRPPAALVAVLVIHGIGQQQPFQPLDSFVNGLRTTLERDGLTIHTTHLMFGRDEVFDHRIRIEATPPGTASPTVRLDVYEFYWAPLTQGKATFAQIIRWLLLTGFTPVRRFAFNLPLLNQRASLHAEQAVERATKAERESAAVNSTADSQGNSPKREALRAKIKRALLGNKTLRLLFVEYAREVWRVVYVTIAAVVIAAGTVTLVDRSSTLVKQLLKELRTPSVEVAKAWKDLTTVPGVLTAAVAVIATVAAVALAVSIPEQIRDFLRLRKLGPRVLEETGSAVGAAWRQGGSYLEKLLRSAEAGVKTYGRSAQESSNWRTEIRARAWFLPLSCGFCLLAALTVAWLSLPAPPSVGPLHPEPVVHALLTPLWNKNLAVVLGVVIIAAFLKRVFVDYIADVALYTTADENSEFFATRTAILKEATRRLRFLLRDPNYKAVGLAGHSLGSVIGYDAINWLRTEAATLREPPGLSANLEELEELSKKLESEGAAKSAALVNQVRQEFAVKSAGAPAGLAVDGGATPIAPSAPIGPKELQRLTTFVTFGSPLNKVLYFFRTKTKVYETVRAHILFETHGFRQSPALLTRDPRIRDPAGQIADGLRWLNVYSPMDPVSARLTLYGGIRERRHWYLLWGWCHTSYWHDRKFYNEVLAALDGADWSTDS